MNPSIGTNTVRKRKEAELRAQQAIEKQRRAQAEELSKRMNYSTLLAEAFEAGLQRDQQSDDFVAKKKPIVLAKEIEVCFVHEMKVCLLFHRERYSFFTNQLTKIMFNNSEV